MSVSRKQLRKAVTKMTNGKEKKRVETDESLEKLIRQIQYEKKCQHKQQS